MPLYYPLQGEACLHNQNKTRNDQILLDWAQVTLNSKRVVTGGYGSTLSFSGFLGFLANLDGFV